MKSFNLISQKVCNTTLYDSLSLKFISDMNQLIVCWNDLCIIVVHDLQSLSSIGKLDSNNMQNHWWQKNAFRYQKLFWSAISRLFWNNARENIQVKKNELQLQNVCLAGDGVTRQISILLLIVAKHCYINESRRILFPVFWGLFERDYLISNKSTGISFVSFSFVLNLRSIFYSIPW